MSNSSYKVAVLVKRYPKISETFILQEILALERRNFQICLYSLYKPSDSLVHESVKQVQAVVHYLEMNKLKFLYIAAPHHLLLLFRNPVRYVQALWNFLLINEPYKLESFAKAGIIANLILENKIDHLHAHFIDFPATVAELASSFSGIPFSMSAHAKDIWLSSADSLKRKLLRASFTVTCTELNQQYLAKITNNHANITRAYHGIDNNKFCPPHTKTELIPPLILSIGRYRTKKGFPTLIEACRLLHKENYAFKCKIVGYGSEHSVLQKQIDAAQLSSHIELTGQLDHIAILDLYRCASVFVLPCQVKENGDRDGIPNVLLEAMSVGLPVITTNISAIPELIQHQENGLLVEPKNPIQLANAIKTLLDNPTLQKSLSKSARQDVKRRFNTDNNITILANLLKKTIQVKTTGSILRERAL